ncbi:MAG: NAD(P)-binding protein [Desulfovibrio sp.]|jgi:UDP-galactopyranose mutase|nr:NAD(P)-binding protein [Desulfovibrio sp.]
MIPSDLKYLVVGAGLWGGVLAERIASELGVRVLVIEKRDHIGGNCHSAVDPATGIECHVYGTHIFHTSIPRVWDYIRKFTEFTSYRHKVLTEHKGRVYPMPIGLATINMFYGLNLRPGEVADFIRREAAKGADADKPPANLEEKAVSLIGRPLYEAFIKGYTWKQWEKDPRELPAGIITRLPVRCNYNCDYFDDPWQGMPLRGYAALFTALFGHPLIEVRTGVSWVDVAGRVPPSCTVLYSGPLDELFGYSLGGLEWRGLRFERETLPCPDAQGTSVLNQADVEIPWTRSHEFKHLHPERGPQGDSTVVAREYSRTCTPGDEPYYPVNTPQNQALLDKYRARLAAEAPNITAGGRLGGYRYLDMDKTIDDALGVFERLRAAHGERGV